MIRWGVRLLWPPARFILSRTADLVLGRPDFSPPETPVTANVTTPLECQGARPDRSTSTLQ